jgi:hypothetical protein
MPDAYSEDTRAFVEKKIRMLCGNGKEEGGAELAARVVLNGLCRRGLLLPEGTAPFEWGVRFTGPGGSHTVAGMSEQQAHAQASHHSRKPGCRGEVLRVTTVQTVMASYPGRSPIPPEPKEGTDAPQ